MPFNSALTGLFSASADLDVTSNNIANVNTTGFKGSSTKFADLFSSSGSSTTIGGGVRLSKVDQSFSQGNAEYTNSSLDLAINGDGFFTMRNSSGLAYTRAGSFSVDRDGNVVDPNGSYLQVFPLTAAGTFDISSLTDLTLSTAQSPPQATGRITLDLNFPASAEVPETATFDPDDATSYNQATSFTVYDSLGTTHSVSTYYVKDGVTDNTWHAYLYLDGTAVGTAQDVIFDTDGSLLTPADGLLAYPATALTNGADDLELTLDLGSATQYGDTFAQTGIVQDGYAAGSLSGVSITTTGVVSATYTNGQSTQLGQVAMASFANKGGLQQIGNSSWVASFDSGTAVPGVAGTGSLGTLQSGALEASNVDLTAQLVNMIKAQRNFSANAQAIAAFDKITQTVINIRG